MTAFGLLGLPVVNKVLKKERTHFGGPQRRRTMNSMEMCILSQANIEQTVIPRSQVYNIYYDTKNKQRKKDLEKSAVVVCSSHSLFS